MAFTNKTGKAHGNNFTTVAGSGKFPHQNFFISQEFFEKFPNNFPKVSQKSSNFSQVSQKFLKCVFLDNFSIIS